MGRSRKPCHSSLANRRTPHSAQRRRNSTDVEKWNGNYCSPTTHRKGLTKNFRRIRHVRTVVSRTPVTKKTASPCPGVPPAVLFIAVAGGGTWVCRNCETIFFLWPKTRLPTEDICGPFKMATFQRSGRFFAICLLRVLALLTYNLVSILALL